MLPFLIGHMEPRCLHPERVGNKAATLARLAAKGYAVPPFFVLPVEACAFALLRSRWGRRSARLSPEQVEHLLQELRYGCERFASAFWQDFERRFADLAVEEAEPRVSVRSSSPLEDRAAHAMAGQFVTRLNISSVEEAWEATKACWLSLWQANVDAYLKARHLKPRLEMAVVVQRMLRVDVSGVLFTQDPVSGNPDRMPIEAVRGSPEGVVSGMLEPERVYLHKQTLEPVAAGSEISGLLNASQQAALGTLGRELEAHFGQPQDIEWAFEAGKLWLLQSRPLTASGQNERQRRDAEGGLWTDYFFVERFAEPVSPLGWSILGRWIEKRALREPLFYLGQDTLARDSHLTRLFECYPFTRVEVFRTLYSVVPDEAISMDKRHAFLAPAERPDWWKALLRACPYLVTRLMFRDLNWVPQFHLRAWRHFRRRYLTALRQRPDLDALDQTELRRQFETLEHWTDELLSYHRWSVTFADLSFHLLTQLIGRWLPEAPENMAIDLISGLPGNRTVAINLALARLSQRLPQDVLPEESLRDLGVRDLLKLFLVQHGHRSKSLDPYAIPWREAPELVLRAASAMRNDLTTQQKQLAQRRSEAERRAREAMAKGWRRCYRQPIFGDLLQLTRELTLLRENQRDDWHRVLAETRRCILEIGRRLVGRGMLEHCDQIFFLTRRELLCALDGKADVGTLGHRASQRRDRWEESRRTAMLGRTRDEGSSVSLLQGMGVSAGRVCARAAVMHTFEEAMRIPPGWILVVRSLDPAWTPLFARAAGLVSEVGGILSHASIVAREFCLPAVTSVERATALIGDGEWIEIDGGSGSVELLQEK